MTAKAKTDMRPKCWYCGRVLGDYFPRPWGRRCQRCKSNNRRGILIDAGGPDGKPAANN